MPCSDDKCHKTVFFVKSFDSSVCVRILKHLYNMIRVHASHVLKMKEHLLYLEQQFSIINDVHGAKVLPLEKIN